MPKNPATTHRNVLRGRIALQSGSLHNSTARQQQRRALVWARREAFCADAVTVSFAADAWWGRGEREQHRMTKTSSTVLALLWPVKPLTKHR